ncbi:MAG: NYN domain-containing protein [Bacillota bacterium]
MMIFIDGSNLYHGLKDFVGRTDVDLGKLAQKLAQDRELVRTYYYNCPVRREDGEDRYRRQQKFFAALKNLPDFEIRLGHLQQDRSGALVEKGVDVSLAVDMLSRAYKDHYDIAVLVSGDGDFARVLQEVKDLGKKVEVAFFPKCHHLRTAADRFILLSEDLLRDCWLQKARG